MKAAIDLLVWVYNQRAGAENLIKEANNDAGLAAHPSEQWAANCVHFQLAMLAYNLNCWRMLFNREEKVQADDLKHTTLVTVRLRFLFVAAKIWRHAGRVGISYSDQYPERGLFQRLMDRLRNIVSWPALYACKLCIAFYAQASERNQRDTNDRERLREKNKSNDTEHTGEKKLMRSEFRLAAQIRRDLCII